MRNEARIDAQLLDNRRETQRRYERMGELVVLSLTAALSWRNLRHAKTRRQVARGVNPHRETGANRGIAELLDPRQQSHLTRPAATTPSYYRAKSYSRTHGPGRPVQAILPARKNLHVEVFSVFPAAVLHLATLAGHLLRVFLEYGAGAGGTCRQRRRAGNLTPRFCVTQVSPRNANLRR